MNARDIELALCREVGRLAQEPVETIDASLSLSELGMDSLRYVAVSAFIEREFGVSIKPDALFEIPSLRETAERIAELAGGSAGGEAQEAGIAGAEDAPSSTAPRAELYGDRDVAIIGAALRLPGASSLREFWELVSSGACKIREFPAGEREPLASRPQGAAGPAGFLRGGFIDDVDAFDAAFFGISAREAIAMDPQHRLFLECAFHAFEDAGYTTARLSGSNTAVFVGVSGFDYYKLLTSASMGHASHIGTGVSHAIIPNRVSHYFNLKGASEAIDTACSSSLVALCRAVEILRKGESDLALVGGANVLASQFPFQVFAEAGMLSPEGESRPFDERAAGYVRGEGVACVVLKRARDAVRDGDRILAIVKGGAVQHSGRTNSLTAPNPDAQAAVIVAAVHDAGVDPESIGYIEAHGTGTALGDPIEIKGLKKAFARLHAERGRSGAPAPHAYIGSVKAQIGHLEAAAGLAGLLKAVAALAHGTIPGSPYITQVNHHIDLSDASFRIPRHNVPWEGPQDGVVLCASPRRAGVSSFGFGGVNAHVVLEAPPAPRARPAAPATARLFLFSAKSPQALGALCAQVAEHVGGMRLAGEPDEPLFLEDLAFTLRHARTPMAHRVAVIATTADELVERLRKHAREGADQQNVFAGVARAESLDVSELFTDEGELVTRLRELASRGELRKLARFWTQGLGIDWDRVLPRGDASLVEIPGYPFARERFWVKPAERGPRPVEAPPFPTTQTPAGAAFYRPRWVPKPLAAPAAPSASDGALVALVAGERGRLLASAVGALMPERPLLYVECPVDEGELQRIASDLLGRAGRVASVLDVTPLDPGFYLDRRQILLKVELLRHLTGGILKRGEPLDLVQVTRGLRAIGAPGQRPTSLAGADDAGFFKALGAEYRRCRSKTVDLASAAFEAETAAAQIAREIEVYDGESEIAYLDGQRLALVMERAPLDAPPEGGPEEKGVALITGGTGEIGLCVASDLVAQGFRALLLTCRKEPSPDKRAALEEMERKGTAIELYRGDLDDERSLREAVERVRAAHGRITHVFHCAGAVDRDTPAFFKKTAASMAAVTKPKIDALLKLHELFADQPPRAFVLFSSVSAVVPRLAAGLSDYAAANRFMDLFAEFQHANGRRYYRSVQWTRWRGVGLARGVLETGDQPELALASEHCIGALRYLLRSGDDLGPSVCVLAEGDPSLQPAGSETRPQAAIATAPRADAAAPVAPAAASAVELDAIRRKVRSIIAGELETPESKLDDEASFEDLGIDSIVVIGLVSRLEAWVGRKLDPEALIRCNSIAGVTRYLAGLVPPKQATVEAAAPVARAAAQVAQAAAPVAQAAAQVAQAAAPVAQAATPEGTSTRPAPARGGRPPFQVAVIGVACRFPGAPDKETFWRNLRDGVDSIIEVPPSRWDAQALYAPRHAPGRSISRWGGFVEGIEQVSPALFGMNAEDAADIDPAVRLFTECGLDTVLDSPYDQAALRGRRVGVFVGARAGRYAERITTPGKASVTGIGQNFIAAFVSHVLDLRGPSLVIDAACSSSLVAIHLACQSLQTGDSELALAGGVDVLLDEKPYLFLSSAHALSPDGRCRTFDENANGFVPGEGVGCVLLKPLDRALADGDPIYAVIDGSAINNDGATLGVTTPGVEGQVDVIRRALERAGVSPRDISYVETHGTGTMIGDPIELRSLTRAFAEDPPASCALGSVKTNIGHLLSAAGIASFIKVTLSLHQRTLPPTLHCHRVNPRFEFEQTPFFPMREARPWETSGGPRRAGISAFGFGKTNAHVVLSERPEAAPRPVDRAAALRAIADSEKVRAWHPARSEASMPAAHDAPRGPAPGDLGLHRGGDPQPAPREAAAAPRPAGRRLLALEEISSQALGAEQGSHGSPAGGSILSAARITGVFTVLDTDPLVSAHRVQDIHILPGVALLDLVYKVLTEARVDTASIVLRDILFHEPVVTNAQIDRKVTVRVDGAGAEGRVTVTSVPWKGERALASDVTTHMTCVLARAGAAGLEAPSNGAVVRAGSPVDLDACYRVTRHIGIFHDGFMKCQGTVTKLASGGFVGDVSLSDGAAAHGEDFLLHPVFLDCSTIVPLIHLTDRLDEASLFIPFAIDEFRGSPLTGRREVRIVVETPDREVADREIIHHSFAICDLDGRELVRFRRFGVKRVRSLEGIRRLLARAGRAQPADAAPPIQAAQGARAALPAPPAMDAAADGGDPVLDLIGALIARHGNIRWDSANADKPFFDLELDSLMLLDVAQALEQRLGIRLYPTLLFERSTAASLAAYLRETFPEACAALASDGGARAAEPPPAQPPAEPEPQKPQAGKLEVLVPRWLPVDSDAPPSAPSTVALLGFGDDSGLSEHLVRMLGDRVRHQAAVSGGADAAASIADAIARGAEIDEVYLVGVGHELAFHLVKTLLRAGRLNQPLAVKALTLNCFRVHEEAPDPAATHGLWGLLQSLSREYPAVRVSQVDLDRNEVVRALAGGDDGWLRLAIQCGARSRELRAIRAGRLYERRLLPAHTVPAEASPLRQRGVYMVIGGAGGVGMELVRRLRREHDARIAVVGRSAPSDELQRKLSSEGAYGEEIVYLSAAIEDEAALAAAVQETRQRFGGLHGIVHSAMVLDDRRLSEMDAESFARPLGPKVAGTEALARVTEGLDLDFILFFSSVQSFIGNVSQANYAAASTCLDGLAASMRAKRRYPVVVINWGYFSDVGAVATERYRALMARQGVFGLRADEAMTALEQVLASGWEQAAIVAAEEAVLEEIGLSRALVLGRSAARDLAPRAPLAAERERLAAYVPVFDEVKQAVGLLLAATRRRIAQILRDLGLLGDAGAPGNGALKPCTIVAEHSRLVQALLHHLAEGGALDAEGLSEAQFSEALDRLAEEHASLQPLVPLLRACVDHYPQILTGRMSAMEVVFPGGGIDLVRPVYGGSAVSRCYNEVVADAVRALAARTPRKPARILEIGAGTGATTIEVLRALEENGIAHEYWYTDLWDKLVAEARGRLEPLHPSLRFGFLDIGTDPAAQGFRDEYDIVVATNVLHATRDLHASLRHAKRLLRPGGVIVINESVEVQEYSTYTFGLLPGWWGAIDPRERLQGSPLAAASTWPALLKDEGFIEVEALVPGDDGLAALSAQQVYVARSDGELRLAPERRAPTRAPQIASATASGLPRALAGKLRPLDLVTAAGEALRLRRLATFQDDRDNAWVFLNNPPANTLTDEMLGELCATLRALAEPTSGPRRRFVYLSHFGEYFSLGGDRGEIMRRLSEGDNEAVARFAGKARALIHAIASLDALVVAVVDGPAQGGGLETLLVTDFQVVRDGVKLSLPEIKSGLIPGMGGLTALKDLVGMARVKRLVMLGRPLSARDALDLGVISHVVDNPFEAALALAEEIKNIDTALYMKKILSRGTAERLTMDIDDWIAYATQHTELIDARRISDSEAMLTARAVAAK